MLYKFKRFIRNWFKDGEVIPTLDKPGRRSANHSLNFTVSPASGGYVLDFAFYDSKTDRHHNHLYVIHDNENLSESIAHIITLECLKHRG